MSGQKNPPFLIFSNRHSALDLPAGCLIVHLRVLALVPFYIEVLELHPETLGQVWGHK